MVKKQEKEEIIYTKYEKTRILGSRSLQLAMGAPFLIKLEDKDLEALSYNPLSIAKKEFEEGVIPITIKKFMPMDNR
ncbi:DNA-directed RNA polymerase subunit K [Nanoarchaeota archaeon]